MAKSADKKRGPRVRKSAPTIRERAQVSENDESTKKPVRKVTAKVSSPFKKLRLRDRKVFKALAVVFRPIKRVLRWLIPSYFVNSWRELRLVHWPNRKETWRLTAAVFVFAIVFGALVAGVDKALDEVFKKLVLK
ncbi:preprotein translocase subunit SecE [Candidatus Saccharibacteria bacterium]|nr:preprotein translocase subunit SecE [Candidatus Saccharibacteria bacterium]